MLDLNSVYFNSYEPKNFLIPKLNRVNNSNWFVNMNLTRKEFSTISISGPSGCGKDTLLKEIRVLNIFHNVKTATTRDKRNGEDDDEYYWMRKIKNDERFEDYYSNLIKEYNLIEFDIHNNNLYGVPEKELQQNSKINLIEIETNGVEVISKKFPLLSIFIFPESYTQLWKRIENRDNKEKRMLKAVEEIKSSLNLCHYFFLNVENQENKEEGILKSREEFTTFILDLFP